ncbi:MAG: metallophosphoesterase family protein [Deltaproteobacteria bacterium]|nr:metallophosphoesterase family protein [Deltaproteobacteria bacterium]
MRIALVSDLHVEYSGNREASHALASRLADQRPDALILAGDAGSTPPTILEGLEIFSEVAPVRMYVPGNHDLWVRLAPHRGGGDSWDAYDRGLAELAAAAGYHYLPSGVFIQNGVGFAGETGWFDFTFRPALPDLRELPVCVFEAAEFEGWSWPDFALCEWGMSVTEVTDVMLRRLSTKLARLDRDPAVRSIVAVTHHVPFRHHVNAWSPVCEIPERVWEYCTVFMGSTRLGDLLVQSPKTTLAVHGHSHVPGTWVVEREGGAPIRVARAPVGTEAERARSPEGRGLILEI